MEVKFIPEEIIKYCEDNSTPNKDVTNKILIENIDNDGFHMMIGNLSSYLLRLIILTKNPKSILELGTFLGYATSILFENSSNKCKIVSLEEDSDNYIKAKNNLSKYLNEKRLKLINHEGISYLKKSDFMFDLIFIDIRKEAYYNNLEDIYNKLHIKGVLIIDNALAGLGVLNPQKDWHSQTIKINEILKKDCRFITTIIPIRDGFTFAIKIK